MHSFFNRFNITEFCAVNKINNIKLNKILNNNQTAFASLK